MPPRKPGSAGPAPESGGGAGTDAQSDGGPGTPPAAIVGLGASAGGLAALQAFFSRVPEDSGLAWVVVVHLPPEHKSHLPDLLQRYVKMPVLQVSETTELRPDHVYVIPPGANLSAVDTHLRLSRLEESRRERAPIDHFLRTLASTHDGHSIGVILTGTGSDGALGIRAIKEKGGLTVAQDPGDAEYDGMPQSAIATGMVDRVLPLEAIPGEVLRLARTEPRLRIPSDGEDPAGEEQRHLQKVFAQLRARTGRDFNRYKRSTILRRIQRRMQLTHVEELSTYLDRLRTDPAEVTALADDLLITVTNFFRDPDVWGRLGDEVIPAIFARKRAGEPIRAWSVGCATGEEAYSLAMLLLEEADRREDPRPIQVFASDLHEHSLERAREGFYPGDIQADVSAERLQRFFQKENGGYRIRKEVRERVVFAPHNLLADPPFSRLDLISCRNVMIYLQSDAQKDVLDLFHYALLPDGFLVLGASETMDGSSELFRMEDRAHHVWRKRNVQAPEARLPVFPRVGARPMPEGSPQERRTTGGAVAYEALHQRMVEHYAPPSLLVSPDGRVVYVSAEAGRYLVMPGGEPTSSVFRLVREELALDLRAALHNAREHGQGTRSKPIPVRFNGESAYVMLDVRPAAGTEHEGFALVFLHELDTLPGTAAGGADDADSRKPDARLQEMQAEVEITRRRLQAVVEEHESAQEEMRASQEELQSSNEELRSTMEELETSREELQSMNEELQTVNQENRHKVEELAQLSGDLQNLLASTQIATLFLDRDMRILRFTPKVGELFNVRPVDRGRPLSDLTHRLGYDELGDDARTVLRTLVPIEREVGDADGRWYLSRVLPYRSSEDRIDGVVITLVDITARKHAEAAVRASEAKYRTLFDTMDQGFGIAEIIVDDGGRPVDYRMLEINAQFEHMTGQRREAFLTGRTVRAVAPELEEHWYEFYGNVALSGEPAFTEIHAQAWDRWFEVSAFRVGAPEQRQVAILFRDISERKKAEEELRRAREHAEGASRAKSQFLAVISHELRTPLTGVIGYADLLGTEVLGPMTEEQRTALERIKTSSWHLVSIIDEILTLSRVEAGREEVVLQDTEVALLTREVAAMVEAEAAARGLRLRLRGDDAPLTVTTDPRKLRQILLNLVGNAIKYTEEGEILVELDASDADWVSWRVRDTGRGIASAEQERIFEAFTQVDGPDTRERGGAGLGLTICRRLARLLGGDIALESAPGRGSTFTVRLPRIRGR